MINGLNVALSARSLYKVTSCVQIQQKSFSGPACSRCERLNLRRRPLQGMPETAHNSKFQCISSPKKDTQHKKLYHVPKRILVFDLFTVKEEKKHFAGLK